MAPQQIQISFQGANWILHDDTVKILSQYSSMFEEIPEIAYFFGGFLWSDYIQSIKTYFWVIAAIWSALSVGCGFCVGIISLFIYCLPLFIKSALTINGPLTKTPNLSN